MSKFVYTNGNLTITNYVEGVDVIEFASGSISKTELTNIGKDVKFTVGTGSVLVKNGAGKVISVADGRGSYTVSGTRIALGQDFAGEMDAGKYLSTVTNIAGSGASTGVTLRGNTNANVMSGGAKADTLYGGEGADKLYGYGGNDVLYGQQGNDSLYGGAGADKLYGGSGNDAIYGEAGDDVLDGYTGNDTLTGGAGNDTLSGGAGKDMFVYANGDGSDTVTDYTAGEDTIKIAGGNISKTELATNGNSTDVKFTVGSGSVLVKSGKGKVISLEDNRGSYTVSDTRIALGADFTGEMDAGKYLSTVTNIAGSGATAGVTLRGNANANVMSGGAKTDTLYGGEGADKLYGYGGNDVLYGQQGNDSLYGGAGDDKLYGGSGDDVIYGNAGDDVLDGYTGNDRLEGGDGNDTLTGGAGNDTFSGGAGSDLFVYANGDGNDMITDYTTGEDTIKIASGSISKTVLAANGADVKFTVGSGSVLVKNGKGKVISLEDSRGSYTVSDTRIALGANFTGEMDAGKYLSTVTNIAGSGATTGVTLRGNANANVMSGGSLADTLYGGEGADKLYGYGGNDVLYGQQGNDSLYGGEGADKLYGGSGDDAIYGNAGNDVLDGYTGNDTLTGGAGNDTLSGGAGSDLFVYSNGDGSDTVTDYTAGEDTIKITGGSIRKTELGSNGKDVTFTVDNGGITTGSITVQNGKGKVVSLEDSRGSYTVSDTRIALGADFTGEMDAGKYLSTVTNIAGSGANAAVTLRGNGNDNVMSGGSKADTLYGGDGSDTLYGFGGNDELFGGDGNDRLEGGIGTDLLYGDAGNDVLYGGDGGDGLLGGDGDDTLYGGNGDDSLYGDEGNNTLFGGAGNDTYYCEGKASHDTIEDYQSGELIRHFLPYLDSVHLGTGYVDLRLRDSSNSNTMVITVKGDLSLDGINLDGYAGSLADYIDGSSEAGVTQNVTGNYQTINGTEYADDITLERGSNNTINALGGVDTITIKGTETTTQNNTVYGGEGNDIIHLKAGQKNKIYGEAGDDTIRLWSGIGGGNEVYGGVGADKIFSNENIGGVTVDGGAGKDTITIRSGGAHPTITGGTGEDTITVYGDGFTVSGDENDDTIHLVGTYGATANGGTGDDTIYVEGAYANNTICGGEGSDTFVITHAYDSIVYIDQSVYAAGDEDNLELRFWNSLDSEPNLSDIYLNENGDMEINLSACSIEGMEFSIGIYVTGWIDNPLQSISYPINSGSGRATIDTSGFTEAGQHYSLLP